jgi:hypothetical protein
MSSSAPHRRRLARLPGSDRAIVAMVVAFIASAFTLELYWLVHHDELPARVGTDALARLYRVYGAVDPGFYDRVTPFTVGLELINVGFTQVLNVMLLVGIVKDRWYRYPLQLVVGSYVAYSVVLYFAVGHLSGYPTDRSLGGFLLFYAPNLPWLLAHLYMVGHATAALRRRFRTEGV